MTQITEDLLKADGWEATVRAKGFLFMEIKWNSDQALKITFDITRRQWRLHYNYNDTDVAYMEDIATLTEMWQHTSRGVLNLRPREES